MGIIINFTDRTVQGFGFPFDNPLMITRANDVQVVFGGKEDRTLVRHSITGTIDRVTGDVEATWSFIGENLPNLA